ncbi:DUF4064 domain-containing protein [Planococcus salinarum]|uniref:DUF4064 domain-containing protein n=1 Tax=Planococcus salinarum TaxID=622695 RepID=UPI00163D8871|nr:DUF4064 domain-containing protein [Planococcus salinarum]
MNDGIISRTGERVLGIIGIVFNVIGIILLAWLITSIDNLEGTSEFEQFQQEMMNDPAFEGSPEEAQMVMEFVMDSVGIFGWAIVALLVLSTIFAIVALINLKKTRSAQLAGIFFILAGLMAGVLSLTSILFYIAAIMCFVRKPPMREEDRYRKDDSGYRQDDVHRTDDTVYRDDKVRRTDDSVYREDEVHGSDDTIRREDRRRDEDSPYRPL